MEKNIKRIPIARCPVPDCGRTLMYSGDPKDKHTVTLSIADDDRCLSQGVPCRVQIFRF